MCETDKTDIYFPHQKLTLLLFHHHQHHCHKQQLTAVSFVRTVATVVYVVTHIILVDTYPVLALPVESGALPVGWTTNKVIAFSVTCKHLHRHCNRLSSFSYTLLSSLHSPFPSLINPPFSSRSLALRVSFIQLYRQFSSMLLSHPLTSTHRHYHFHWSSFLPFTFIVTSTPIEHARTGMVKARTGTGLLILCLYRLCVGMVRVSALTGLLFCFVFC